MKAKEGSIKEIFLLAYPLFISQSVDVAMIFSDRFFLSDLGKNELASTLPGGILNYLFSNLIFGILAQMIPLISQYYAAKENENAIRTFQQGFFLFLILSPIAFFSAYFFAPKLLSIFGHEENLYNSEIKYFRVLCFTIFTLNLRVLIGNFFIAIGRTKIVTVVSFFTMLINIPVSYVLIFGKFGFPKLGVEGAALGTLIASISPVFILGVQFFSREFQENFQTKTNLKFDKVLFFRLLRYGLPTGFEMIINVAGFMFFCMVMYSYSSDVAAAISIVLNWDMLCFIPMFGISQSVGSLVGKYLGEGKKETALKTANSSLILGIIYASAITICCFLFTSSLVKVFTPETEFQSFEKVLEYGVLMLKISCAYFIADSMYQILGGILKGAGDSLWTMFMSNSLMWTIAISVYICKNYFGFSPIESWMILSGMVFVLFGSFFHRFYQKKWLNRLMIRE